LGDGVTNSWLSLHQI